jgi:hypothetical protein
MCGADKVRLLAGALLPLGDEVDRFAAPNARRAAYLVGDRR